MEQIWNAILEFTSQFVIPDWGSIISLLPVFMAIYVIAFFVRTAIRYATAGPKRVRPARLPPTPPAGVHMPGPSFAPFFAAVGTFLLFYGLVFGGPSIILGLVALLLTLLYWGREALAEYDHVAGGQTHAPALVHGEPPPGIHIPGPSFRPILASLAVAILFAGLVFGGWLLGVGLIVTVLTLLGWLNDARKEYRHVVEADKTGHLTNEPAPGWPTAMLSIMTVLVVASVALNLGWFPPRSASGADEGGASPAPSGPAPGGPDEISLVAEQVKFDKTSITAPADKPFKITFDNRDVGTPHDVDILDGAGTPVFEGPAFPGPEVRVYDVPPLAAGAYKFICSIHPALMTGELTVGG